MADQNNDQLKELLTQRASYFEKITDERFTATTKALELQAREYERRLHDLNGEAARLRVIQETYIPREVYEVGHKELQRVSDARYEEILRSLSELKEFRANYQGRQSIISIVISFIVSLIIFYIGKLLN